MQIKFFSIANIKPTLLAQVCLFFSAPPVVCQSFNAEVVKYTSFCEVSKEKLVETDTIAVQINNREGEMYSNISLSYSKSSSISSIDAWIENSEGRRIRSLKKVKSMTGAIFQKFHFLKITTVNIFN